CGARGRDREAFAVAPGALGGVRGGRAGTRGPRTEDRGDEGADRVPRHGARSGGPRDRRVGESGGPRVRRGRRRQRRRASRGPQGGDGVSFAGGSARNRRRRSASRRRPSAIEAEAETAETCVRGSSAQRTGTSATGNPLARASSRISTSKTNRSSRAAEKSA